MLLQDVIRRLESWNDPLKECDELHIYEDRIEMIQYQHNTLHGTWEGMLQKIQEGYKVVNG